MVSRFPFSIGDTECLFGFCRWADTLQDFSLSRSTSHLDCLRFVIEFPVKEKLGRSRFAFSLCLSHPCHAWNSMTLLWSISICHPLMTVLLLLCLRVCFLSSPVRLIGAPPAKSLDPSTLGPYFPASVACWFILLHCILIAQSKSDLQLFRNSELCCVHAFQCVIHGSLTQRQENFVSFCVKSLNIVSSKSDAHEIREFEHRFTGTCSTKVFGDHVGDLSPSKKWIVFLGFLFLQA